MPDRITQQTISASTMRGLQDNLGRVQKLQDQLSSGRRIAIPSDDPSGTSVAMQMRSQRAASEQYLRNMDQVSSRLGITDNTLTSLSDRLRSVRELMVGSQNGALSTDARSAIAAQVDALRSEAVGLYNTTYLDRPIFGGTVPGQLAVDPTSGAFVGNNATIDVRISRDTTLRTDVTGAESGADTIPALLQQISTSIAGTGATAADFTNLDAAMSTVLRALGDVGARQSRVDSTHSLVDSQRLDFTSRIAEVEDIDMPRTIMDLQSQQVGYQAALGTAAKVLQHSLLDFLR